MTSQAHAYTRFKHALKSDNAHLALDAPAELQRIGLADALSLLLLIREDKPVLYDQGGGALVRQVRCGDRHLLLRDARELIDLLDGVGRHGQGRHRPARAVATRSRLRRGSRPRRLICPGRSIRVGQGMYASKRCAGA